MNLKGKLHQSRLVFSSALNNAIDMNEKHIYNTTIKYTINTIQETNIQCNNKKTHMMQQKQLMTMQQ